MHQKTKKATCKHTKILSRLLLLIVTLAILIPANKITAASPIKIRYNSKTETFKGQQVAVTADGKSINLGKTPGLELINNKKEEIYMVPAYDVFQKGLRATYKKSGKNITISQYDITIKMTVGSKTAYVNGVKKTLDYAPTYVKYIAANQTKLLVPARFVATSLGYNYAWTNNSSTQGTIKITNPLRLHYDEAWHTYRSTLGKVTYNGEQIDVSDMYSIVLNNTALLQANKVFSKSDIDASYKYDSKANTVTIKKEDTTILMEPGSRKAYVNEEAVTLATAPRLVKNGKTNKEYIMVPGMFVAETLGYRYTWNSATKTSCITKGDCEYFNWYVGDDFVISDSTSNSIGSGTDQALSPTASPEPTVDPSVTFDPTITITPAITPSPEASPVPEEEPNYLIRVDGSFVDGRDVVTIETSSVMNADVTSDSTHIYITLPNTMNTMEDQSYEIDDTISLVKATMKVSGQTTTITLTKHADIKYTVEKDDTIMTITLGGTGGTAAANQGDGPITIAIDCGHGANTAGKRTPPVPFDLDFDNDGVVDVKKGQQIREHVGNVGVGEYLAEELRRCGFKVYESAFGSEDVPLSQRQSNIKKAGSDYSISIHFNAMGDGKTFNSSNGVGIFYYKNPESQGDSKNFAQTILNQVIKGTPQKNNGINGQHTFAMCKTSAMGTKASILIECAFMTNLHEATTMMTNADYWKETAQEIAKGVCEYTGVDYIPE